MAGIVVRKGYERLWFTGYGEEQIIVFEDTPVLRWPNYSITYNSGGYDWIQVNTAGTGQSFVSCTPYNGSTPRSAVIRFYQEAPTTYDPSYVDIPVYQEGKRSSFELIPSGYVGIPLSGETAVRLFMRYEDKKSNSAVQFPSGSAVWTFNSNSWITNTEDVTYVVQKSNDSYSLQSNYSDYCTILSDTGLGWRVDVAGFTSDKNVGGRFQYANSFQYTNGHKYLYVVSMRTDDYSLLNTYGQVCYSDESYYTISDTKRPSNTDEPQLIGIVCTAVTSASSGERYFYPLSVSGLPAGTPAGWEIYNVWRFDLTNMGLENITTVNQGIQYFGIRPTTFVKQRYGRLQISATSTQSSRTGYIDYTNPVFGSSTVTVYQGSSGSPLTVNPSSFSFSSLSQTSRLNVTFAGDNIYDNRNQLPSWMSFRGMTSGTGQRGYDVSVAANYTSSSRSATIWLSDDVNPSISVPVTQAAGAGYNYSVSPSIIDFGSGPGSGVITVDYGGQGYVSVSNPAAWVTVSVKDFPDGEGGSRVRYDAIATSNPNTSSRTTTIGFSGELGYGETVINQSGRDVTIATDVSQLSYPAQGGTEAVTVTWTSGSTPMTSISYLTGGSDWLTEHIGRPGASSIDLDYTAAANYGSERTASIRYNNGIDIVAVSVYQSGSSSPSPYEITVDKSSITYPSTGGTESVVHSITAPDLSTVAVSISTPDWITGTSATSTTTNFTAASNPSSAVRTGTINYVLKEASYPFTPLDTKDITVSQAAGGQTGFNVSPQTINFDWRGVSDMTRITVVHPSTSDVISYSISYNQGSGWINRLTGTTGADTNYYTVLLNEPGGPVYSYNNSYLARTATIDFLANGQFIGQVTVVQDGVPTSSLTADPSSLSFIAAGDWERVWVTSGVPVTVTVPSGSDWLSYTAETVTDKFGVYIVTAAANTGQVREGVVNFRAGTNDLPLQVSQGSPLTTSITITPSHLDFSSDFGVANVTVTYTSPTPVSLGYSVLSGSDWITVSDEGTPGVYSVTVPPNRAGGRTGTVDFFLSSGGGVIKRETLTVTQAYGFEKMEASPDVFRFGFRSGTGTVIFINVPAAGIIHLTPLPDWLTVTISQDYTTAEVSVTQNNATSARSHTVRFVEPGQQNNYVEVYVYQQGVGGNEYTSIWADDYFDFPDGVSGQDYPYVVLCYPDGSVSSSQGYYGVAASATSGTGMNIPSINIPRLADDYVQSSIPSVFGGLSFHNLSGKVRADVYKYITGETGTYLGSFNYWNDWSRKVLVYDSTRTINDPVNYRGCNDMYIPFCVFCNDRNTFSIDVTPLEGRMVNEDLGRPSDDFAYNISAWTGVKTLAYYCGAEHYFTYDLTHCGEGYLMYRNRFGGWDSFLIEGNIVKSEGYTRQNYRFSVKRSEATQSQKGWYPDKYTEGVDIGTSYTATTGWLSDKEAERFVYHILSSPMVLFHSFRTESYDNYHILDTFNRVIITDAQAEYKKFRNGRNMVNYTFTFEEADIKNVKR